MVWPFSNFLGKNMFRLQFIREQKVLHSHWINKDYSNLIQASKIKKFANLSITPVEAIKIIKDAIIDLERYPEYYIKFEPPKNRAGSYESFIRDLREILKLYEKFSNCQILIKPGIVRRQSVKKRF